VLPGKQLPKLSRQEFRGHLAPDFELPTLDGRKLRLSDLRGQAVLLNLWCRCGGNGAGNAEIPTLVELQNEYGPQDLQVIGVSLDEYASAEDASDYAREMNVNYRLSLSTYLLLKSATTALFFCR
jgi:cytochrome c biogenesis protein CcmG, thiol:disulfide interchange protein DsbE